MSLPYIYWGNEVCVGKKQTSEMFYEENEVCEHMWRLKVQQVGKMETLSVCREAVWVIQMLAKQESKLKFFK